MRTVSAALCCSLVAGLAAAQVELYVADYEYQAAVIRAVGLDGSNPRTLFDIPAVDWLPIGLSFNPANNKLYWIDSGGAANFISANLDGSSLDNSHALPGFCRGTSLDAQGRIYFASDSSVMRIDADGSNLITLYSTASGNPTSYPKVDATNQHVYAGADGQIIRMDLDGSNQKVVVNGVSQPRAIALDVANNAIYWLDADTHSDFVGRARLDGSGFTVLFEDSPGVVQSPGMSDLAVYPPTGQIFYSNELRGDITRIEADGSSPTVIYTSPTNKYPEGIVFSTGEPVQAMQDLNHNGIQDDIDIANGEPDCDNNGVPDVAQSRACAQLPLVADQGSDAASFNGRALGLPSQWQIFQPFDVPAGGWQIGSVGLDGYASAYFPDAPIVIRLFPDDGSGTKPNEAAQIAEGSLQLLFNTNLENWVYAPLAASLPQGRVWVRLEMADPISAGASINSGFTGLQSKSRGSSGNFTAPAAPIAVRLVSPICAADLNVDGIVDLNDFFQFFNYFDITSVGADLTGDGVVDLNDFFEFLNHFDASC